MTFFLCQMVTRTKKIFVGGLSTTTTLEEVRTYFSKFGEVSQTSRESQHNQVVALIDRHVKSGVN